MDAVTLVEVGPRDGFQAVARLIPTTTKIAILQDLFDAGIRRVEATSFVSASAVPQLADAAEILAAAYSLPGLDPQVLAPTARQTERALRAGARHLAFVLSVSERHNLGNVRRPVAGSIEEYAQIVGLLGSDAPFRLNVATAFDCPHDGKVEARHTLDLLEQLVAIAPYAEIALCDTTGRATPRQVRDLFTTAQARFPVVQRWAFHGHDTYGMGAANVLAAWDAGVRVVDASVSGLGGCPFAPGATGNVATEDLVWMFEGMGVSTGIGIARLTKVSEQVAALPGASIGGRVRDALAASAKLARTA